MSESLYTCPRCEIPHFHQSGLKAHVCRGLGDRGEKRRLKPGELKSAVASPPREPREGEIIVATTRPLSLADLDAMPVAPVRHASLEEMSIEQLGAMFEGLDRTRTSCESMSGICATLAGLVLIEVKKRVGHGHFKPWLKEHFPKSQRTAQVYMRLGSTFSKSADSCAFDQMTLALMDGAQDLDGKSLDLTHPVVAEVAKWTKGRSFYQITEDVITKGGNRHPKCPHCDGDLASKSQGICPHCEKSTGQEEPTPEDQRAELLSIARVWADAQMKETAPNQKLWKLLPDQETEAVAAWLSDLAAEMRAWTKIPQRRRAEMAIEEVLS